MHKVIRKLYAMMQKFAQNITKDIRKTYVTIYAKLYA